jgi:hypothetical protein
MDANGGEERKTLPKGEYLSKAVMINPSTKVTIRNEIVQTLILLKLGRDDWRAGRLFGKL